MKKAIVMIRENDPSHALKKGDKIKVQKRFFRNGVEHITGIRPNGITIIFPANLAVEETA